MPQVEAIIATIVIVIAFIIYLVTDRTTAPVQYRLELNKTAKSINLISSLANVLSSTNKQWGNIVKCFVLLCGSLTLLYICNTTQGIHYFAKFCAEVLFYMIISTIVTILWFIISGVRKYLALAEEVKALQNTEIVLQKVTSNDC